MKLTPAQSRVVELMRAGWLLFRWNDSGASSLKKSGEQDELVGYLSFRRLLFDNVIVSIQPGGWVYKLRDSD